MAQVAIRWLLQRPPVTSVIIGSKKIHQLGDNMGACGWKLTQEEVRIHDLRIIWERVAGNLHKRR